MFGSFFWYISFLIDTKCTYVLQLPNIYIHVYHIFLFSIFDLLGESVVFCFLLLQFFSWILDVFRQRGI
jgi:hypothetical protein